jgi:hypothetical protein
MYEGYSSSQGGYEAALMGFDWEQIQEYLGVRPVIKSVQLRLSQRWSYSGSGKQFHTITHNHTSKPTTAVFGPEVDVDHWTRGEIGEAWLGVAVGDDLRDGNIKGFGIRYTGSTNPANWGYMAGRKRTTSLTSNPTSVVDSGNTHIPRLTIVCDYS